MVAMRRTAIAAASLSALLLWASSPAVGAGWLAWVALVPVAVVVLGAPDTPGARLAVPLAYVLYLELLLVPALPFGLAEGQWGDVPAPVMIADSPVLAVALVAIPLAGAVLYLIRFGQPWGAAAAPRAASLALPVLVPACAWTALDFVRAKLEPGGSWGPLYLSQVDTPFSELAALGGPWLLTAAIVAFNYGLALALVRRTPVPVAVPAATLAAALLIGAGGGRDGTRITVAAVQPGYDTAERERPELRHWRRRAFNLAARDVITDLRPLTERVAEAGAELVVWPEAVTFVDLSERAAARARVVRAARRSGATIVAPYFDRRSSSGAVLAVGPGGRVTEARPKRRPMWFLGERRAEGLEAGPLEAGGTAVGALLGVDVQDPGVAAALSGQGARLFASSTHDWDQLATQHRALSELAAAAAGAPVVRADWRYGSAIYDRDGAIIADAGQGRRRAAITASVELGGTTPYGRIGDLVGWIAVAVAAGAWLVALGGSAVSREGGPAAGGRAPRRESRPRPPSPAPPRAGGGPSRPPA